MALYLRILAVWLGLALSVSAQLVTLPSLDVLLNRVPIRNETLGVASGRSSNDWGGIRLFRHYTNNSGFATNLGNVFQAKGATNGQWVALDRTNSVQDIRWWGGGPAIADNTQALTNAANYVVGLGGGYAYADVGTYSFLSSNTITPPSGARLKGAGPNATTWNFTAATPSTDYQPAIRWVGSISGSVRLQSATVAGARTLVLASPVDWSYGDRIQIRNTNDYSFGSRWYYNAGEFNTVYSNTGGTNISLVEPLEDVYPTNYTVANKVTPTTGSAEGIRFAWHEKSGGIQLDYADQDSYLVDCEGAGSEDTQFDVRRSYGVLLSRLNGDWDSDPSSGLGYILTVGDSENVTVEHCYFRSSRHGFSAGGSTIPTRYLTVAYCDIGSTRQNVAGADFHENVVKSSFVNCYLPSGVSLGGGLNTLENCFVRNGLQYTAVGAPPARYYDWTIRNNEIEITPFGGVQTVWGIRLYLQAGSQSGYPAATNYWPGTFGATENQRIRITDNVIRFVGVATNNNFAVFVDEAPTLGANTNFSAAMFAAPEFEGNEIFFDPAQPVAALTTPGVVFAQGSKIRWPGITVRNNYLGGGPLNIITTGGTLVFSGNTVANSFTETGCYIYTSPSTNLWMPADVVASDNDFGASIGSAMSFGNLGGEVMLRNNRVANHGSGGGTYGRFAFPLFETANPYTLFEADGNRISSTHSPTHDYYVGASVAPMYETWTQLGGSTTKGTRPAAGSHLAIPRLIGAYGATNAVTLLGQYAALPTPARPALAHMSGDLWYTDGSSWTNFVRVGNTNDIHAPTVRTRALTVGDTWPVQTNGAIVSTYPIYVQGVTNELMRVALVNTSTGGQSGVGVQVESYRQAEGRFSALSTNNTTAARVARVAMDAVAGAGLGYDLYYPGSMDIRWTYGGGTEFARLNTNTLSVPGLTTTAPTNTPTHVLTVAADPSSTRRAVGSFAVTSAGLGLLNAANASAQRSSLGLGTIATINDAPSDGNQYVRSNATWAIASGGGGGVSTNLDNLTVTNLASFLNLVKIYDASGASLLVDVASGTVTVYPNLSVQGSVTTGSGGLGVNGPAVFLATVKQGPSLLDLYSLTSVGINGAAPVPLININSTTPAAPYGGVNGTFQIDNTNVTVHVPFGVFTNIVTVGGVTNSTSTNTIWTLTLPPLTADGQQVLFTTFGAIYNATGSSANWDPVISVNGGQKLRTQWSVGSSGYRRSMVISGGIRRLSSTTAHVWSDLDHSGVNTTTNNGYGGTLSGVRMQEYPVTADDWGSGTNTVTFSSVFGTASTNFWLQSFGVTGEKK